jgi:hypothetical protein
MWHIGIFDKTSGAPFPIKNRTFVLDWSRVPPGETENVLQLVEERNSRRRYRPSDMKAAVITVSRTARRQDRRLLKYRDYFYAPPEDQLLQMMKTAQEGRVVGVGGDYFEDETGREITEYEMIQFVSGQEYPVIAGDPNSVLRLGSASPTNLEPGDKTSFR